ncbi:MAG: zinc-dependent metalloprotease, partial [Phycisphaerales bacterium]|nr:zinc-dependent metalloprotease [Phycisphaerales bacterium]
NTEIAFEAPVSSGQLVTFHYSLSNLAKSPGYSPREADDRVGYFVTSYKDLGQFGVEEQYTRYINRWHLEKADPKRRLSPPKEPIVFYIDHTVPVRYRRFVRQGIEYWNKAFEEIGILNAIEVRYQDSTTGAHMDKDPEDVRYNFIRWLSNDISTAIGPSRVHPETGEILDADIVLTDGWIRVYWNESHNLFPDLAMEGYGPETLAWFDRHPEWDPRILLASPSERDHMLQQRHLQGIRAYGGHPAAMVDSTMYGDDEYDGLVDLSQHNGCCMAAQGKGMELAMMRMHFEMLGLGDTEVSEPPAIPDDLPPELKEMIKKRLEEAAKEGKLNPEMMEQYGSLIGNVEPEGDDEPETTEEPKGDKGAKEDPSDLIDGVPDWFIGPALADLTCHEVGHTLGLRHNFKASSVYTLDEMNSGDLKTPITSSVMDYNPTNFNYGGEGQGDYFMTSVGEYDKWAIAYGYGDDHKKQLERCTEPALQFQTDEDTWGPDPFSRRYDFTANPIDYANTRMRLVHDLRE